MHASQTAFRFPATVCACLIAMIVADGVLVRGAGAAPAPADTVQSPPPTSAGATTALAADQDPTRPVLFSLRNEYRDLRAEAWANTVILRMDRLVVRNLGNPGGAKGVILRADLPQNTLHSGTGTTSGLGDLYAQAIYIPRISRKAALAVGSGLFMPTASDKVLGRGKWILAPVVGPVWFFRGTGFAYIKVQDYFSFAGASDRAKVHYLSVDPTLTRRITSGFWVQLDTEAKHDWITNHAAAISGVQIGRMVRGDFGGWIKLEIPWGYYREGDWTIKLVVFHVR